MPRPLVFVLMSQRSGTSALVHTLNEHPGAAIGIERYKELWPTWPEAYDPAMFESERFFALDAADTNILGTERWDTYYARKRPAWGPATLSGDKVQPISVEMVRGILAASPQARFLYPFRQLLPLASSYAVRAGDEQDGNWHPDHGAEAALRVWRQDNRAVLALLAEPDLAPHVLPIAYEDYFRGDATTVAAVLDHVGLQPHPDHDAAVAVNAARYDEVQGKQLRLSYREVADLLPHVADPAYLRLQAAAPRSGVTRDVSIGPEQIVALQDQVLAVEDALRRTRNRRSVRAALAVADGAGRLVRRLRG